MQSAWPKLSPAHRAASAGAGRKSCLPILHGECQAVGWGMIPAPCQGPVKHSGCNYCWEHSNYGHSSKCCVCFPVLVMAACWGRRRRKSSHSQGNVFVCFILGSFCIGSSLLLNPDDVMMLCQGTGAVWRWLAANKEAERQEKLLSTSCLSPRAFALHIHPCQSFRVTQGLSNLPCTAAGSCIKVAETFPTKKNVKSHRDFQPQGPLPMNPVSLLATSIAYQQINLVFLSQAITFPTSFLAQGKKQSQRLPKLIWRHGCTYSYKWGKCCLFSLSAWHMTACYTKSAAKLPPTFAKKITQPKTYVTLQLIFVNLEQSI